MSQFGEGKESRTRMPAVCIKDASEVEDEAEDATDDEASAHAWMKIALENTDLGLDIDEESIEVRR